MSTIDKLIRDTIRSVAIKKDRLLQKALCAYFEINDPLDALGHVARISGTEDYIDLKNGETIISFEEVTVSKGDNYAVELRVKTHQKINGVIEGD